MTGSTTVSDLLAYALFDSDPRAQNLKEPLHVFLVSLAIFNKRRPCTRPEIDQAVRQELPNAEALSQNDIESAVAAATRVKLLVKTDDGRVGLPPERHSQLTEACDRLENSRKAFHSFIREAVETEVNDTLSDGEAASLTDTLEAFLGRVFQEGSVALSRAFEPGGPGFDETMEAFNGGSLANLAAAVVPASEKLRRAQVAVGIRSGLFALPDEARAYLAGVYQKTVAFALLEQDPSIRRVKRNLARQRIAYLDTNVAIAYLFESHPLHDRAVDAIHACQAVGCHIRVSRFTLDELDLQMKESQEHFNKIGDVGSLLQVVDDDILRSFAVARGKRPSLTWTGYFAEYYPPKDSLAEYGLTVDETGYANAIHDDRCARVRGEVRKVKKAHLPDQLISFDVHNLILIQNLRSATRADEMGNRLWLITLDRSLRAAERRLVRSNVFPAPSSMRAQAWTNYLSPTLAPDSESLQTYVTHLVQSQLGLIAEDPMFVSTNFLITLQQSPFDTDKLLAGGAERAQRVLTALQTEREVKNLLQAPPANVAHAEEWLQELSEAVERTLSRVQTATDQGAEVDRLKIQRDEAQALSTQLRRDRDHGLRKISELEERIMALEASSTKTTEGGLFSRLRRFMSGSR